ncbi:MAG: homoserine kinase [Oscillospiraceae bacterium]
MIKISIPATSANLGSGFDSLGVALSMYNTVFIEENDTVDIASLDDIQVPSSSDNLVFYAAERLYDICGKKLTGLKIRQKNDIPMARGLGSSSACLIAGLLGANTLLNNPLAKEDIINLAAAMEGHPDNTTPALLGGLVTCAMSEGRVYSVSVPIDSQVRFVAMIPSDPLPTHHARSVLPQSVSRDDAVFNLSRAALMTSSLFSGSLENLKIATDDRLHQPYRMGLIKGSAAAFRIAKDLGAFGVYISGAGSTIMAIIDQSNVKFEKTAMTELKKNGVFDWQVRALKSDAIGAVVSIDN